MGSKDNPKEIRDWRIPDEWPAGAKPVTRKIQYDDLYRVKRVDYEYAAGDDTWTSPFAPELASIDDPRRAPPSPHVGFDKRILWQTYNYDWLGNTSTTDDDARGFYDRSLGTVTNDTANDKPYQLKSATNDALGGTRTGAVDTVYDAAGNLTRLDVERNGTCLGSKCSMRLDYRWDEVGRLVRARRWDVVPISITTPDAELPSGDPDADLEYVYDASDDRVLKTARDESANAVHTAYIFDTLELRRTTYASGDYTQSTGTGNETTESEVPYLFGHGVRLGRVVYEQVNDGEPRVTSAGRQHVFFELGDHLGSTSVVLDKETSELVERGAFQAYGAKESDYRPDRWKGFREDYGFTGKEEDVEVGLTYFGKRFLSPYLGRWVSADPLGIHMPGRADLNLYAYVTGHALKAVDPLGLEGTVQVNSMPEGIPESMRQAAVSGEGTLRWTSVSAPGATGGLRIVSDGEVSEASKMSGSTIYEYNRDAALSYSDAVAFQQLEHEIASGTGQFSWMQPTIAPEHVWTPDDSGLRGLGAMVGTTAAGSLPVVGEVADLAVIVNPSASGLERTAAAVSFAANILTAGVLPNAGSLIKSVPDDALRGASGAAGAAKGRAGAQQRLREIAQDPNTSSADRGWIKQETNAIDRGKRTTIRNPPGKQLAHMRGREAAKGYNHTDSPSNLQDTDLHKTQHKFDGFGRKNKGRP